MVSTEPRRNLGPPTLCLFLSLLLPFAPATVHAQSDLGERPMRSDQETIALPPDDDEICDDVEEGDEDYSDGSILTCAIASATADSSTQTLLIEGAFCESPAVSIGGSNGLDLVTVFASGPAFIQADLSGHAAPATRVVLVECPCGSCAIDSTVGAVGPPGPTGPTGPTDPDVGEDLDALHMALCENFFTTLGEELCGTCKTDQACNDFDDCTVDACEDPLTPDAVCTNTTIPDGGSCAGTGQCFDGVCTARYAFITSIGYASNLGGLAGADANCNERAAAKNLPGVYKAWLSDGIDSPSTTFVQHDGPYVRVDHVQIADDWTDLTDGSLDAPLGVNENGNPGTHAWSGTLPDGTPAGDDNCAGWTSTAEGLIGHSGRGDETDGQWSDWFTGWLCNHPQSKLGLYCFQQ